MTTPSLYSYRVRSIERVVDGDTFDCILDLGFNVLLAARVRMAGVDTPESRTADAEEKVFGLLSKEWLKNNLHGTVIITTQVEKENEKFGRVLGTVYANGKNLNQAMIQENMAVAYSGQNKDNVQAEHHKNRIILKEKGLV